MDQMVADRKAEIFAAAVTVFADRGVHAAQLAEVARAADVDPGLLHRAFGGAGGLLRAAVPAVARGLLAHLQDAPPAGSAVDRLRNFCGRTWEVLHTPTYVALHGLWLSEGARHPDLARAYADEVLGALHAALELIVARGVDEGAFRPVSPPLTARVLLAALVQQAVWAGRPGTVSPRLGEHGHRAVADTLALLLDGLKTPATEERS